MADERTSSHSQSREQEYEQLQTALEVAETEIQIGPGESPAPDGTVPVPGEKAHLRHLLANPTPDCLKPRSRPEIRTSAHQRTGGRTQHRQRGTQISLEELQVTTEELEEANAALQPTNGLNSRSKNAPDI